MTRRVFRYILLALLPLLVAGHLLTRSRSVTVGVNDRTYRSYSIRDGHLVVINMRQGVPILPGGTFFSIDPTSGRAGGMWSYSRFRGTAAVEIPLWPLVVLVYLPWVPLILKLIRRCDSPKVGICVACGYDLRGTPGRACPECGAARA